MSVETLPVDSYLAGTPQPQTRHRIPIVHEALDHFGLEASFRKRTEAGTHTDKGMPAHKGRFERRDTPEQRSQPWQGCRKASLQVAAVGSGLGLGLALGPGHAADLMVVGVEVGADHLEFRL